MGKYTLSITSRPYDVCDWSKETCCKKVCQSADLIKILIDGYEKYYKEAWSYCLPFKWSLGDCVAGCHNDFYDLDGKTVQYRHVHQTQLSRTAVSQGAEKLEESDKKSESIDDRFLEVNDRKPVFVDFESLYEDVRKDLDSVGGIGDMTIYDTALRIGWNQEPRLIPEKYVYLHRGAMDGALALLKLSRLSGKPYFSYEGKLGYRVPITCFREDLQALGANHLEDFLCIFHQFLQDWSVGYEIRKKREAQRNRKTKKDRK